MEVKMEADVVKEFLDLVMPNKFPEIRKILCAKSVKYVALNPVKAGQRELNLVIWPALPNEPLVCRRLVLSLTRSPRLEFPYDHAGKMINRNHQKIYFLLEKK